MSTSACALLRGAHGLPGRWIELRKRSRALGRGNHRRPTVLPQVYPIWQPHIT